MANEHDVARGFVDLMHGVAKKIDEAPTGVKPGFSTALGGAVLPNGKLRSVSENGALLAIAKRNSDLTLSSSPQRLDFATVQHDPNALITTGASWAMSLPYLGIYDVELKLTIDQNSLSIAAGEYWDFGIVDGGSGGTIVFGSSPGTVIQQFWQANQSASGNTYKYRGRIFIEAFSLPASFYVAYTRTGSSNDRLLKTNSFILVAYRGAS